VDAAYYLTNKGGDAGARKFLERAMQGQTSPELYLGLHDGIDTFMKRPLKQAD
jgi:hypothetical protein